LAGRLSTEPFGWQAVAKTPQSLRRCAELFNAERYPAKFKVCHGFSGDREKIRIGCVSGEFRDQATSHLIVGVLEHHDKSSFEVHGFDNGWNDGSNIRRRIEAAIPTIIDIRSLNDGSAAAAIHGQQIDILINLNGYFGEERTGIFSERPAPIQVNYLGFPGTLGAPYMDYLIADRCVIPPDHQKFYAEKIVYLPECYQANDDKKYISERIFTRTECALPSEVFVFCCFNNSYKIVPDVFDCWMHILRRVEGSVLWLLEDNPTAAANLRREAAAKKVNPERLVFAKRMPLPDHLARHRLADLFLDTLPYNAHTTASDALWAGLPAITQIGDTFPGRVAASLLLTIGLGELITSRQEAYQGLAIELATNRQKLLTIKRKLAQYRLTSSLFDTQLFTRRIEAAYRTIYERHQRRLPPDHVYTAR
jgi:predicted O-linked N-acetylglucosamine transferase (SPINDLY family)